MSPTPISKFILDGREFFVKRDELFDPYLAGNKFRKLHTLLHTPKERYTKIISYGGTQSNAMLAIARMCEQKSWEFEYYSKPISKVQQIQNSGNLYLAKALGMIHKQISDAEYRDVINGLQFNLDRKSFVIEKMGAIGAAKEGLEFLAQEIREQNPSVNSLATPSGTGTTALFLALSLPEYKVYTVACVGDEMYLRTQMLSLCESLPKNLIILKTKKKYHFAKLYENFYKMYKKTLAAGIEFDTLYAPAMWETLLEQTDERVLYIHSGGVTGNETMLNRYKIKFNHLKEHSTHKNHSRIYI